MEEMIVLDVIDPNPYQPREKEDPEHVQKIADSIAADGLMQVPVGRRVGDRVQLAFGHSRLAAYKLLHQQSIAEANKLGVNAKVSNWCKMPVTLRELTDEEMFRLGISENLARKDLTPLEEARAMARYRDDFKKTSAEIGALFGLNESTVRGKIRLLGLPEEIQASVAGAQESVLRELATVFEIPADVRDRMEKSWAKPSELVRDAATLNAQAAASRVNNMLSNAGKDMSGASWKFTDEFPGQPGILGPCKDCQYRLRREGKNICLQPDCYNSKLSVNKRLILAEASQETGIAVAEDQTVGYWEANSFGHSDQAAWDSAREARCPNLRLLYQEYIYSDRPGKINDHTVAVCSKRKGQCTCMKAADAGVALSPKEDGTPVTVEELQQVARDARRLQKENIQHMQDLRSMASVAFGKAVAKVDNYPLMRRMLHLMGIYSSQIETMSDRQVLEGIGDRIVEDIYPKYQDADPVRACALFNSALKEIGLPELETPWTVSVETVDPTGPDVPTLEPQNGKTLSEIFAEHTPEMLPGEALADYLTRTELEGDRKIELGYLNGDKEHLIVTSSGQMMLEDQSLGPNCDKCGRPMPRHRVDADGWAWYHCSDCDTWKGDQA